MEEIRAWFRERIPAEWFEGEPSVEADGDEIYVVGRLSSGSGAEDAEDETEESRIARFRATTREERVEIARDAEVRFARKVAWGLETDENRYMFTHLAIPAMTRLRLAERQVLDTLVEAGVARSRADALAWCVRYVGREQADWLDELRSALVHVEQVRGKGPRKSSAAET